MTDSASPASRAPGSVASLRVAAGALSLLIALLAVWTHAAFIDSDGFAQRATAALDNPAVRSELADRIADAVIEQGSAELVTVRPLLEGLAAELLATRPFRAIYRAALREAHASFFGGDEAFVLRLADVTILLSAFAESLEELGSLPSALRREVSVLRARNFATGTLALAARVDLLAWLIPSGVTAAFTAWLALASDRRRAWREAGTAAAVAGVLGVAGIVVLGAALPSLLPAAPADALRGVWNAFAAPLRGASLGLAVAGLALGAAATAGVGDGPHRAVAMIARWFTTTPSSRTARFARALLVLGLGVLLATRPEDTAYTAALGVACLALWWGLVEILQTVGLGAGLEHGEEPAPGPATVALRTGLRVTLPVAIAAAIGVWLLRDSGLPAVPFLEPRPGCNGHVALCNRPFDQVAFASTHNAMSAASERGWYFASHGGGIAAQLRFGIRGFLIDAYYGVPVEGGVRTDVFHAADRAELVSQYGEAFVDARDRLAANLGLAGEDVPRRLYLCHGLCELGATPLSDALAAFRSFLEANPREVLVVFVEDHVPADSVAEAFVEAGLEPYAFTHRIGDAWPTLGEMIASGKRLLVMAERDGGGPDWYHPGFELTQETHYSFKTDADFDCEPNRGRAGSPLFQLNHWIEKVTPSPGDAARVNRYPFLLERALACQARREHIPNLVAVNFYELGDTLRVVDVLNGIAPEP